MAYIIVPSDFSESSFNALKSAVDIAQKKDTKIIILHTYQRPASQSSSFMKIEEKMKGIAEDEIKKLKKDIEAQNFPDSIEFVYESINSSLTKGIRILSKKYDVRLVVMGLTGASAIKEIFVGSNSLSVIQKSEIPVVSIPKNASIKDMSKVIFATDFINDKPIETLEPVLNFCRDFNVEITFLYIHNKDFDINIAKQRSEIFINKLSNEIGDLEKKVLFVEDKSIFSGINKVYESENADLLIIVKRSHSFIEKLFKNQVTSRIVLDAKLPILSIKE